MSGGFYFVIGHAAVIYIWQKLYVQKLLVLLLIVVYSAVFKEVLPLSQPEGGREPEGAALQKHTISKCVKHYLKYHVIISCRLFWQISAQGCIQVVQGHTALPLQTCCPTSAVAIVFLIVK